MELLPVILLLVFLLGLVATLLSHLGGTPRPALPGAKPRPSRKDG